MEMVNIILNLIDKYGWWSILGAICIGIIYLSVKYLSNKITTNVSDSMEKIADKVTNSITDQNAILISAINKQNDKLLDIITESNRKEQQEYHGKLFSRIDSTESINTKLKNIGYKYHADRVAILEFHNSSQNLLGIPFAKYSCNFEWINRGSISLQAKCQSLPFSMISVIVKDLMNSDSPAIVYESLDSFADMDSGLYTVLQECHAKSLVYSAIYDDNNRIIGLLALEYHKQIDKNSINLHELVIDVESITTVLNLR